MARVADWLRHQGHKIKDKLQNCSFNALVRDTQDAHRKYLKALIAHGNHEECSEACRLDCEKKVQAKREWRTLQNMVKRETEKRKMHTTG